MATAGRTRSRTRTEREHILRLLEVARLYWQEGLGQAEIAERINFSRPTVSRLLTEARERGVIRIRIGHPLERVIGLEERLAGEFGLALVRVADPDEFGQTQTAVARCAADVIVESMPADGLISVSNGQAVAATVEAMPELELTRSRVVQMIGSLGRSEALLDSTETCRNLAARLGGRYHSLPVPLVVSSPTVAAALREEDQIATTLELAARADLALVGVGAFEGGHSGQIFAAYEDPATAVALREAGAVGHICGHHFNRSGHHLDTPLCARTIAVAPERMREIDLVVGVAWGANKVPALRGALAGRFISGLVTDRETATSLLSG